MFWIVPNLCSELSRFLPAIAVGDFTELFGIKRKQAKIPAVQWEIGQVKTGRKETEAKLSLDELNWVVNAQQCFADI